MRFTTLALAGALLMAGTVTSPAISAEKPKGEAALQKVLEGRVAGKPVDCIQLNTIRSSRIIDRTAIVYEAPGGVLYVNRPRSGQQSLTDWNVQVTRTQSSQLCSIDTVRMVDRTSQMFAGSVFLGEFVPYTKVKPVKAI